MRRSLLFLMLIAVCGTVIATTAEAKVLDMVVSAVTGNWSALVFAAVGAALLAVFKVLPNDELYKFVKGAAKKGGRFITLGLNKWKYTKPIWQNIIEPWIVDLIRNTVQAAVDGLVEGLYSDNE